MSNGENIANTTVIFITVIQIGESAGCQSSILVIQRAHVVAIAGNCFAVHFFIISSASCAFLENADWVLYFSIKGSLHSCRCFMLIPLLRDGKTFSLFT